MRVTTSQLYDRPMSLMARLTAEADTTQTQIATQKKFTAPSGDASAYLQLQGLKRAGTDDSAYSANIVLAQNLLSQTDSALGSVETQLQRARELTTQAATGTLTDANREAIAKELDSIRDELFALANSKDTRGQPLFGSATGTTAYAEASDGTIAFVGSGAPSPIPISAGDAIHATVPGDQLFGSGAGDMFAVITDLSAALKAGGDVKAATDGALSAFAGLLSEVGAGRASVGARGARLELDADRLADIALDRETARGGLEDTDIASAMTQLQKTLTVLQATQSSFTKLTALSLFDYLR